MTATTAKPAAPAPAPGTAPVKTAARAPKGSVLMAPAKAPAKKAAQPAAKATGKAPAKAVKAVKGAKPTKAPKAPKLAKAPKPEKLDKAAKPVKLKPVRDSFTMPEADFALIAVLKRRLMGLHRETKKSELLRAGLHALAALDDASLRRAVDSLAPVKVGRPPAAP